MSRKPSKLVSTHELAQLFSTSGDNVIRDLGKVGLSPRKLMLVGGRSYRKWDRDMAVKKLTEVRADRRAERLMRAEMAAVPPAEAAAAKVETITTPLTAVVTAQSEQIAALTVQVTELGRTIGVLQQMLADFLVGE